MSATSPAAAPAAPPVGIFRRMRPVILVGLAAAAIRLGLDFAQLDAAKWVGVIVLVPAAFLVAGVRGTYDDLRWPRLALGVACVGLCCWFVPNAITYPLAQFLGWSHGRFRSPEAGPPIQDTALLKVGVGLAVAAGTTVFGTLSTLVWATLVVWLPGFVRRRRAASAA